MLFKLFPMCYPFKYVKFELNQLFQFTISLFYKLVVSVDLLPDNGLFILPKSVLSIAKSHLKILLIRVSIYLKFFHWKVFLGMLETVLSYPLRNTLGRRLPIKNKYFKICFWGKHTSNGAQPVWPDWAIYWTLGNFLKPFSGHTDSNEHALAFIKWLIILIRNIPHAIIHHPKD